MLPPSLTARFEVVQRLRPVELVAPDGAVRLADAGLHPLPVAAPYVGLVGPASGGACLALHLGDARLGMRLTGGSVRLEVGTRRGTTEHRSRRHHRSAGATEVALTLTGPHLTGWCREGGAWVARARRDLRDEVHVHDEAALAGLRAETSGPATAGGFGQLGLRDVRLVTDEAGTPLRSEGALWLTATAAGPGGFDSGHTGVWRLDPSTFELERTGALFFRRPDRSGAYGDHATHVLRRDAGWFVTTSTWGDFEEPPSRTARRAPSTLRVTLAETRGDLLRGTHVLDTRELPLPPTGTPTIAAWDPHVVRRDGEWWVGYVAATRFFRFHPAVARGRSLDALTLAGADVDRTATEGTTLLDVDGELLVLASDGRDGPRGHRAAFPVLGLDAPGGGRLTQRGALAAPYPTNIPWPTLARVGDGWLMVTFDGRRSGGELLGYGTHGDLVLMRSV